MTEQEKKLFKAEQERREAGADRLCRILGVSRGFIFDPLLTIVGNLPSLDPTRLEKWLIKTGRMENDSDESIRECLERHYGKHVADLAESLI